MTRDPASLAQHQAANPASSTWLSANAGSGKTKVLIDRVARLLLAGVSPQHILCLTYTKAAATEMQNRLFARLGDWAMMPQAELMTTLADLGGSRDLDTAALGWARQLFARAIESPGGLRIQTIHSFCATLLRRFPLEAGVSPAFQEMDDRAARLLRETIIQEMAEHTAPSVVQAIARHYSGQDFLGLMTEIASHADGFSASFDLQGAKRAFGLGDNFTQDSLLAQTFLGNESALIDQLRPRLRAGGENNNKAERKLGTLDFSAPDMSLIAQLETVFLFGKGAKKNIPFTAKIDDFPTKPTRLALPSELHAQLLSLMLRIEAARPQRIALQAAEKTAALHAFAQVFLPAYQKAKTARGLLDFDDLIDRAIGLLTDRSVAAWVLFRLDGGIDHILVDEAQDTSPKQWRVVESLAEEFTAGFGATQRPRSLFVVGDKKQSIYSFQGADVAVFDQKRATFAQRFSAANQSLEMRELQYSFRSSPAILRVVDDTFGNRFPRALGDGIAHVAFHDQMPGRCDLWPVITPPPKSEMIDPRDVSAQISADSAQRQLAEMVAQNIRDLLASEVHIPIKGGSRAVTPGDILILVRKRSGIFEPIIRACKQLNLPIAGADRLRLAGELAVRDLAALLHFLATPEDDLSLAAALRSPLFGLQEADIFALAHGRTGYLWAALREGGAYPAVLEILTDLRNSADFLRPYDIIERVLTYHHGRQNLIARLGPEAEEGIDELLSQALSYEQGEVPSLTGFLLWLEADDITIKRQVDSGGQLIRVMTVHGAKGLEAPIVILPETADHRPPDRTEIMHLPDGTAAWRTNADESPPEIQSARAKLAESGADEGLRLLYVALTRAQSWLIVAAAGTVNAPDCWYKLVGQGMQAAGSVAIEGGVLRHQFGIWPQGRTERDEAAQNTPAASWTSTDWPRPDWLHQRAAPAPRPAQSFAPSRLSGPKTLADDSNADPEALALGSAVHRLLEVLPNIPPADWAERAQRLTGILAVPALSEARRVLQDPALQSIFADGLAEVAITAPTDKGRVLGYIDRLILRDDQVIAVDFKTNAAVPATAAQVPSGLLAQMGAYLIALQQIYPTRQITIALLWTKTAQFMPLDHDMMKGAFARAALP